MESTEKKNYYFVTWNMKTVCFSTKEAAEAFKTKFETNPVCAFIGIEIVESTHNPFMPVHESIDDFKDLKLGEFPSELKKGIDIRELKGNKLYFFCYDFRGEKESICFDSLENAVKEQIYLTNHSRYNDKRPIYVVIGDYFSYGNEVCSEEVKDDNDRRKFLSRNANEFLDYNWDKKNYNRVSLFENEPVKDKKGTDEIYGKDWNDLDYSDISFHGYKLAFFPADFPLETIKKYIDLEYESYKKYAIDNVKDCIDLLQFRIVLENWDGAEFMSRGTDGDDEFKEKVASFAEKQLNAAKQKALLRRIQECSFYCKEVVGMGNGFFGGFFGRRHCPMVGPLPDDSDEIAQLIADELSTLPNNLVKKIVGKLNS